MEVFLIIIVSLFIILFIIRKIYTKNGFYEEFHSNGKLKSQTNWKGSVWKNDNRPVGLYKQFSDNGVLITEGNFDEDGKKHGIWKNFHEETGGVFSQEEWDHGELISDEEGEDYNWINPKLIGSYTIQDFIKENTTRYKPELIIPSPYFNVWLKDHLYCTRTVITGSHKDVQPYTGIRYTTYLDHEEVTNDKYCVGQLKSIQVIKDGNVIEEKNWDENGKEITSEPNKGTSSKSKKVENKKSNFGTQYYELEETLLGKNSSYNEEYGFIKSLREKLKSGEVYLEDMSGYIKNHHKKYDGGEIMTKTELYNQLEHIFTVYLEDWEKKKETTFVGFEDVEQYHSLSQKIVVELGDLLQEKIMELGK